jgi:hypothetical protein
MQVNDIFNFHPTKVKDDMLKDHPDLAYAVQRRDQWYNVSKASLVSIPVFLLARYCGYLRTSTTAGLSFAAFVMTGVAKNVGDLAQKKCLAEEAEKAARKQGADQNKVKEMIAEKMDLLGEFLCNERAAEWCDTLEITPKVAERLKNCYPEIYSDEIDNCSFSRLNGRLFLAAYYAVAAEDLRIQSAGLQRDVSNADVQKIIDEQKVVVRTAQCYVAYLQHLFSHPDYLKSWQEVKREYFPTYIQSGTLNSSVSDVKTLRGMIK